MLSIFSMSYVQWCNMEKAEQDRYLRVNCLEFQGYTMTGSSNWEIPTHIEFCKKVKVYPTPTFQPQETSGENEVRRALGFGFNHE